MKNVICIALIISLLLISSCSAQQGYKDYLEVDISKPRTEKVVASDIFTKLELSLPQLVKKSELIVIGSIVSEKDAIKEYSLLNDSEIFDNFHEKFPDAVEPVYNVYYNTFKIEKVIEGRIESNTITFSYSSMQTEVPTGISMLLLLNSYTNESGKTIYRSTGMEDGIFQIDENLKITSMSNNLKTSAYDGNSIDRLISDVKKAWIDDSIEIDVLTAVNK